MNYFTADTHFGHENIIKHCQRPFGSLREMDDELVRRWNAVVKNEDIVFHLGDIAYHCSKKYTYGILEQLNGSLFLVPGSHDYRKNSLAWLQQHVTHICPELHTNWDATNERLPVVLCHYPMSSWYHRSHGVVHMHGHTHALAPVPCYFNDRMGRINVGVDAWDFAPVSWVQIKAELAKGLSDEHTVD